MNDTANTPPALKVMLLKDATHRLEWVTQALRDADCEVVHFSGSLIEMEAAIQREAPAAARRLPDDAGTREMT